MWRPYQQLFSLIRGEGLQIIPDLSLVARGMNDVRYLSLLPDWLWGRLQQELPARMPIDSLKYLDQHGRDSVMATSLWASEVTIPYFRQFMQGFATHMAEFAPAVRHIQLGVGPEGEWRYPFLGHYAEEGLSAYFPCYSQQALGLLAGAMLQKYATLAAWQQAWQQPKLDLSQPEVLKGVVIAITERLTDPDIGTAERDFCRWYHESLVGYGRQLLLLSDEVFGRDWQQSSLGLRLPSRLPALLHGDVALAEAGSAC